MSNGGSIPAMAAPMMVLCTFAATAAVERPSGESVEQQQQRMLAGINSQLTAQSALTNGQWQAVWLGLTPDRANLAYIAQSVQQNAYAVSLRGTQFTSLVDLFEDLDVGTVLEFTPGYAASSPPSQPIMVSLGAMNAFTAVTGAVYIPSRTNLLQALVALLDAAPPNPTLYVTGHSLGGAMATMVALYLAAQSFQNQPIFQVYTFAAPTAGLQPFADYYDNAFPGSSATANSSWMIANGWDLVPNAWATLQNVQENFYPSFANKSPQQGPGPAQNVTVNQLIGNFIDSPGSNVYFQPTTNPVLLNSGPNSPDSPAYGSPNTYDPSSICPTTADFSAKCHGNITAISCGCSLQTHPCRSWRQRSRASARMSALLWAAQ